MPQKVSISITFAIKKFTITYFSLFVPLVSKKETRTEVVSMKITSTLSNRLDEAADRAKISKSALAQQAIEAAVEAIERNGYKLVIPIEFEVTHVPSEKKGITTHVQGVTTESRSSHTMAVLPEALTRSPGVLNQDPEEFKAPQRGVSKPKPASHIRKVLRDLDKPGKSLKPFKE